MSKPKIIVLCGSTKYVQIMSVIGWLLERDEGAIVMGLHLLPWWYPNIENIPDHLAEHEDCKEHCDSLHMRKIDMADEVFVVNKDHYIGNSTRREIEHAQSRDLPLRWYTDDQVGGMVEDMLSDEMQINNEHKAFIDMFNHISEDVNHTATEKGWWLGMDNDAEKICLMHSELSEALEALRHHNPLDDKVPKFKGVETELADTIIRIMDFAFEKNHRVAEALIAKMLFNKTREYKHSGKKF